MSEISVRYIVDDVDAAVDFYTNLLGFEVVMRPDPRFAMLCEGRSAAAPERADRSWWRCPTHARWSTTGTGRVVSLPADGPRPRTEGRRAACRRRPVPQRHRRRARRDADPPRRPFRQPCRAVRAPCSRVTTGLSSGISVSSWSVGRCGGSHRGADPCRAGAGRPPPRRRGGACLRRADSRAVADRGARPGTPAS